MQNHSASKVKEDEHKKNYAEIYATNYIESIHVNLIFRYKRYLFRLIFSSFVYLQNACVERAHNRKQVPR